LFQGLLNFLDEPQDSLFDQGKVQIGHFFGKFNGKKSMLEIAPKE